MPFSLEPSRFEFPTRWTEPWIGPPSMSAAWCDVPPPLAIELVDRIDFGVFNTTGKTFSGRHPIERVRVTALRFYSGYLLVEIQVGASESTKGHSAIASLIYGPEGVTTLDGTSTPIHDLNRRHIVLIDPVARLDYVRFFCAHVRGDDGPFRVVEDLADVVFRPRTKQATRDRFRSLVAPLREDETPAAPASILGGLRPSLRYRFEARVVYAGVLFRSYFSVAPTTGMIEMLEDEPLTKKLPLLNWTYESNYRIAVEPEARSLRRATP